MRLLICAGGTGGGVYPAMAVLQGLQPVRTPSVDLEPMDQARSNHLPAHAATTEILWAGSVGGMETELVRRSGVNFTGIPAAGVHGVGLSRLPGNLVSLARGYNAARRVLADFKPDVLFFTGGYVGVPVALAGRGLPSVVYVPDVEPGLALKFLARFATRIAVSTNESRAFFPPDAPVEVSGYPVRADLMRWERRSAQNVLGLDQELPTLLVFGGSKGARSINRALLAILPDLLKESQVVHISGELDWPEVQNRREALAGVLAPAEFDRYHAFPYLHDEMGAAFAAADLVVCRAGASTLGELPAFRLPAILVPYPHAWRYQRVNAEHLHKRKAAVIVEDSELPERLLPQIRDLLHNPARLNDMHQAAGSLARPQAAEVIGTMLRSAARPRKDVNP